MIKKIHGQLLKFKIIVYALFISAQFSCSAALQPKTENLIINSSTSDTLKVQVKPARGKYVYAIGEEVTFQVKISGDSKSLSTAKLSYEIGLEKMKPTYTGNLAVSQPSLDLPTVTLDKAGFLRCKVFIEIDNKKYTDYVTVGYSPDLIEPTATMPSDFDEFWKKALSSSAKTALKPAFQLIEEKSKGDVNVYRLSYQFKEDGKRFYGIICIPKQEGKYPAIIRFPGAGVRPLGGDLATSKKGFITLDLNIHSIPLAKSNSFYDSLQRTNLLNYQLKGKTDRDSFYFKDVILGCVKSVDMIFSLPQFNGNLGVWGSSQGGALSTITTALSPRIKNLVVLSPALSDLTGYLHNRAGGWPHLFDDIAKYHGKKQEIMHATSYYDVVNFAKRINVEGFYSLGFNDETTPPTSTYSVYNSVKAPKQLLIIAEGKHKIYPEQREKSYEWLMEKLKK